MRERTLCVLIALTEGWRLTLREVHAVAYLAQVEGVDLGLHFWYDPDGPWSKGLTEAIQAGEMGGLVAGGALCRLKTSASSPFVLAAYPPSDVDLALAHVVPRILARKLSIGRPGVDLCKLAARHYRRVLRAKEKAHATTRAV